MTQVQWFSVSLGVVLATLAPWTDGVLVAGVLLLVGGGAVCMASRKPSQAMLVFDRRNAGFGVIAGQCLVSCGIGLLCAGIQFLSYEETLISEVQQHHVEGCVISRVIARDGIARFIFASDDRSRLGRRIRYRLTWRVAVPPKAGSCWRLKVRAKPLRGTRNEVGFDFERWLFAQRLSRLGSVQPEGSVQLSRDCACAWYLRARESVYQDLTDLMQASSSGALVAALGVGIRDGFTPVDWDTLQRTGTAHLMAISGLHIGLAAMLGFSLGRFIPVGISGAVNLNHRGAVSALMVAVFYAGLAGFAVSTLRALLMLALWHLWRSTQRSVSVVTTLLITVAVLLLMSPWMAADTGFWLSVVAVAAIALAVFGQPASSSWRERIRLAVRIQLGLTLLLVPLALSVAHGISWVVIPVNLLLVPLFSVLIVPLVLLLLGLLLVAPQYAVVPATILAAVLDPVWAGLNVLAEQPWAFTDVPSLSMWTTVPVSVCGLMLLLPSAFPGRLLAPLLSVPLFFVRADTLDEGTFQIDVLDVGQALAVVIQTRSHYTVYDTGNAWAGGDSAQQVLVPLLEHRQAANLHALIVSHADRDHAGGAVTLQARFAIDAVWVGEPVAGLPAARTCAAGTAWRIDGVHFAFLHPPVNRSYEGNEQSCVLLIQGANHNALLTGDLGGEFERRLIHGLRGMSIDLVVGAHHGSLSSSDARFVSRLGARFVVFSNGYANQWGMPRDAVVDRWESAGTQVFTTAQYGQLQFGPSAQSEFALSYAARTPSLGRWRWRSSAR